MLSYFTGIAQRNLSYPFYGEDESFPFICFDYTLKHKCYKIVIAKDIVSYSFNTLKVSRDDLPEEFIDWFEKIGPTEIIEKCPSQGASYLICKQIDKQVRKFNKEVVLCKSV